MLLDMSSTVACRCAARLFISGRNATFFVLSGNCQGMAQHLRRISGFTFPAESLFS